MRITVISRSWPSNERSGVSLAAASHVKILASQGHGISIIGASRTVLSENLPVQGRYHVSASGSGALYSPSRVDREKLAQVLRETRPDLVIVEAWQTALTDAAVEEAG